MILKKTKDEVVTKKSFPGLIECEWKHKVKETTAACLYTGPKISPQVWHEVLAFFRWTNDEHHSESQVRLYVNPVMGRWGAWAFPQEARTGMTAKELDVTETPEKAAVRFAHWESEPSGDWIYFGTVHHHCSASAFQSGTDENNEKGQEGLHITMGHMGRESHDLHARFYLDSTCFEPDMSMFWEIGEQAKSLVPPGVWDDVARYQMCRKVESTFPEAWRENVIEIRGVVQTYGSPGPHGFSHGCYPYHGSTAGGVQSFKPKFKRTEEAAEELEMECATAGVTDERLEEVISYFDMRDGDPILIAMLAMCDKHDVGIGDLIRELKWGTNNFKGGPRKHTTIPKVETDAPKQLAMETASAENPARIHTTSEQASGNGATNGSSSPQNGSHCAWDGD